MSYVKSPCIRAEHEKRREILFLRGLPVKHGLLSFNEVTCELFSVSGRMGFGRSL
jgi:hypothetical protein